MRHALFLLCFSLLSFASFAETFDQCTDRAWEKYDDCFLKCGAKLGCQKNCVDEKNRDLKKCKEDDASINKANKALATISAAPSCVESSVINNEIWLELKCQTPHRAVVIWYRNDGTPTGPVAYNIARDRRIATPFPTRNGFVFQKVEPMQTIYSSSGMSFVTCERKDKILWCRNSSGNRHVAFSFQTTWSTGASLTQHNVVPPGKVLPVLSDSSEWKFLILGAELEPE